MLSWVEHEKKKKNLGASSLLRAVSNFLYITDDIFIPKNMEIADSPKRKLFGPSIPEQKYKK